MKITLDIPDDYKDQRLTLIAGNRELVATKNPIDDFWLVKIVRCNMCGECCLGGGFSKHHPFPIDEEGHCSKLILKGRDKWRCGASFGVPFMCIADPPEGSVPTCSIRYKKQLVERHCE